MKKAIIQAIKGGYKKNEKPYYYLLGGKLLDGFEKSYALDAHGIVVGDGNFWSAYYLLLDPAFWKALSVAEGWDDKPNDRTPFWTVQQEGNKITFLDEWENVWHSFLYHLSLGQSVEQFFHQILK